MSILPGNSRKIRRGVLVVAPIAVAGMLFSGATASAGTVTGSCSSSGSTANYSAVYSTSGSNDNITTLKWTLAGSHALGGKNNVEARAKYDKTLGHDTIKHTWISGDNVHAGSSSLAVSGWDMARSEDSYVEYKFAFDIPGGDPHCSGHTAEF